MSNKDLYYGKFVSISGAIIQEREFVKLDSKVEDLEVVFSFSDLGDRGNFKIVNNKDCRIFIFEKGHLKKVVE